jgi:hypothetical protein
MVVLHMAERLPAAMRQLRGFKAALLLLMLVPHLLLLAILLLLQA